MSKETLWYLKEWLVVLDDERKTISFEYKNLQNNKSNCGDDFKRRINIQFNNKKKKKYYMNVNTKFKNKIFGNM